MSNIDIGSEAIDRESSFSSGYTFIAPTNPANGDGTLTQLEIWANSTMSDVTVATFYQTNTNEFSTRDYEYIGTVLSGSKQQFAINIDVQIGDYLGIYWSNGNLERTDDGSTNIWYLSGNNTNVADTVFNVSSGYYIFSFYAIGITNSPTLNCLQIDRTIQLTWY